MSGLRHEPTPGAGLRHAIGFAVAFLTPVSYSVAAATASLVDGFPVWTVVVLAVGGGVAGAVLSVLAPASQVSEILARGVIIVALAVAVRFIVPSPGVALADIRGGEAGLVTPSFWVTLILLAVSYTVGHGLASSVAVLATQAPSVVIARHRERRALIGWWAGLAMLLLTGGMTAAAGGMTASVLIVAGGLASLVMLADLRIRTPSPDGVRPPILASPRRVRLMVVAFATMVTVAGGALVAPLIPIDALRSPPSMPSFDIPWWTPEATEAMREVLDENLAPTAPVEDGSVEPGDGLRLPRVPWQLLAVLSALLVVAALRPHRWRAGLRRLWLLFRRSRSGDVLTEGELLELAALDAELDEHDHDGRLARMLRRFRPRPRDPRSAVLHEYFHVERLLSREELGRESYETPHEHAVRIHVSDAHAALADLAADARFARSVPDHPAVTRSRELRREIEQALRGVHR